MRQPYDSHLSERSVRHNVLCPHIAAGFFGKICAQPTNIIAGFFNIYNFGEMADAGS